MNTRPLLIAAGLFIAAQSALADGDTANGQKLFQGGPCSSCHGKDGLGTANQYPILAGQYKDYLIQALREYKNGGRNNPIMKGMAANLSDQDIKDIAEYLSGLPGPLGTIPKAGD
ncbi:MAG TPA: cytochrome c [Gammaproteobacteria bacterium]|nr:cytochrome c [Gammaproteobacteria bacterium]